MTNRTHKDKPKAIPAWSWIMATLGLVLVAGSAGFMIYQAFTDESSPPALVIETGAVVPGGSRYLVEIRVTNQGGSVAKDLVVEGVLHSGAASEETSTITMDYVPVGSQRSAGLIFSKDPRKFDMQIRAKGYEKP